MKKRSNLFAFWVVSGLVSLASAVLPSQAVLASDALREESRADFAVDRAFLLSGGIQYHYSFVSIDDAPESSPSFRWLSRFDFPGYWSRRGSADYHVVLGRVAYVVNKPVSFFSKERTLSLEYLRAMLPEQSIQSLGQEAGFSVFETSGPPSCQARLKHVSKDELEALSAQSPERLLADLIPELGRAEVVGVQRNDRFGTVMGFKTAQGAVALTGHYAISPTQTLLHAVNLNFLHNIPPAFLGGEDRVKEEAQKATLEIVRRIRSYRPIR